MTKNIFRSIFIVALSVLLLCTAVTVAVLHHYFRSVQMDQLRSELMLAADAVERGGISYLEGTEAYSLRLTWIAADGSVIYDSQTDANEMENHADREEIKEAFESGTGESIRYSSTLTEESLYCAKRLSDSTVLRVSLSHASILALAFKMYWAIAAVFVIGLILSALLARRLSKKIVEPLNDLDLEKPLENNAYDELSPLLTHIEKQHRQIAQQITELDNKQNEFLAVIKNMNEGLVLLNRKGIILSINPAAAAFFSASDDCIGKDFLTIEREPEVDKALQTAAAKGHSEIEISRGDRAYRLHASRIQADNLTSGIVILVFDITDTVFAERNRREFTANVSHELKTPLHCIMGSAELMENGMVKAEDIPQFAGRIRSEAARLVTLIEDIIRLSQLDESHDFPTENVDLYQLATAETEALAPFAKAKHITVSVTGQSTVIKGVRQLLHEIIYNLCDNAVKYNIDGGSVTVTVGHDETCATLSVSDTGIGIPKENQARVFERFYRVDKSHSKETGGTGLGLSIVKHAVQHMGGTIHLDSTPGAGTTITVSFPLQQ